MYQSCETGRTYDVLKYIVNRPQEPWMIWFGENNSKTQKAIFLTTKMGLPKQT